ncbi:MAG: 50S ribosomal protein L6 [Limibaculum sp.]
MSRIGKRPIDLPSGVTAAISGQTIEVKGPKGTRSFTATDDVDLKIEGDVVRVAPRGSSKRARQQWGMTRTQVANLVTGVTEGFRKELAITGVGYRAQLLGKVLKLQLGYSHDVEYAIPDGIEIACAKPTEILVSGIDQQQVGQVAAESRAWSPPEPYKGKGILYKGEYIYRKEGKKK